MIKRSRAKIFKGLTAYLFMAFLLTLILNACGAKPAQAQVVPTQQPVATVEATSLPSPTPIPTDVYPPYLPLTTDHDVPPQTISGVTATIDWAYADESRVAVRYTISGLNWPDRVRMPPMVSSHLSSKVLSDSAFGATAGGEGLVSGGIMDGSIDQMLTANAVDAVHTPFMDLQVDISVDGTDAMLFPPPLSGQTQRPTPINLPNIGIFHFEFEIPVYKGIKVTNINQTVKANGVAVTLKSLILNRSHADALLCFQMPSQQDWQLQTRFTLGSQDFGNADGSSLFLGNGKSDLITDTERCVGMGSDVIYDGGSTSATITIPKLITSVPDSWLLTEDHMNKANQKLADKGIVVAYNNDAHNPFTVVQRPEGATDPEVYPLIWEALADWYEGPWVFTVEVNPEK